MPQTRDPKLALLAINNDSIWARWNIHTAIGTPVASPGGVGTAATVTYQFPSAIPNNDAVTGFQAATAAMQTSALAAMAHFSEVANIRFTPSPQGSITYGFSTQPITQDGVAKYPAFNIHYDQNRIITGVSELGTAGNIWIADRYTGSGFAPGTPAAGTLMHELGHAVGLKHTFEDTYTLASDLDNKTQSIMSYTSPDGGYERIFTPNGQGGYSVTLNVISPDTLGILDMAALQALYGANTTTRTGDDVYRFDPTRMFFSTIWDAGGVDTLSAEGFVRDSVIDLREGQLSSLHVPAQTAPSDAILPADLPKPYDGTRNVGIAYGAQIENAVGGKGNDVLIGNALGNRLNGGAGKDTLTGGDGDDVFAFSRLQDSDLSPRNLAGYDVITDLQRNDRIDLSALDANTATSGDDAFNALVSEFTGAGQIRLDGNLLLVNVNADATPDMGVMLQNLDMDAQTLMSRIIL